MQSQSHVCFNVTLSSEQGLYDSNLNQTLLNNLRTTYNGKCLDGQFIVSVDSIVKRSLPNVIRRDLDAKVRTFVVANVTVIKYDQYDIVCDMKVAKIIPRGKIGLYDTLQCANNHCKVLMNLPEINEGERHPYSQNDVIPIKVNAALLKIKSSQVLIKAFPFIPSPPNEVVYKILPVETSELEYVQPIIEMVETTKLKFNNSKQELARIEFFTNLLTTYKNNVKPFGTQVDLLDLLNDLPSKKGLFIFVNHEEPMSNMKISLLTNKQIIERNLIVSTLSNTNPRYSMQAQLHAVAIEYVKHLEAIMKLAQTYDSDEMFERHQYIWTNYENHKL